ncbi:hypothetical protein LCGC14_1006240 [marine sediment metagenome]|uniref:Uncharacterized protein n=1 Tax=marine sediment metagenome TaxID=412755 RepID=A0A0F9N689_9ZZZZ
MMEAPKVFCKKENRDVPIWWCLGSFTQGRVKCVYSAGGEIHYGKSAKTYCQYPEEFKK